MQDQAAVLSWIEAQQGLMENMLEDWCNTNSGSFHLAGLSRVLDKLKQAYSDLSVVIDSIPTPDITMIDSKGKPYQQALGNMLYIKNKPAGGARNILLCGHMDTVFPENSPFNQCQSLGDGKLNGPGVADMKGGLLVILFALQALERSGLANKLNWELLINADEELGSPGSAQMLKQLAKDKSLALVFEPSTDEEGTLAGARKGSAKFTLVAHGIAAHAGRAFHQGHNAIVALAEVINDLNKYNGKREGVTINIGLIHGGSAVNVVADLAICQIDIRYNKTEDQAWLDKIFSLLLARANQHEGIEIERHGGFTRPPKIITPQAEKLYQAYRDLGKSLGQQISWQATGGCCDGNNLAAAGLPVIDTLGVRGGNIHSAQEYIVLNSLVERAQLTALFLMRLANGEIAL